MVKYEKKEKLVFCNRINQKSVFYIMIKLTGSWTIFTDKIDDIPKRAIEDIDFMIFCHYQQAIDSGFKVVARILQDENVTYEEGLSQFFPKWYKGNKKDFYFSLIEMLGDNNHIYTLSAMGEYFVYNILEEIFVLNEDDCSEKNFRYELDTKNDNDNDMNKRCIRRINQKYRDLLITVIMKSIEAENRSLSKEEIMQKTSDIMEEYEDVRTYSSAFFENLNFMLYDKYNDEPTKENKIKMIPNHKSSEEENKIKIRNKKYIASMFSIDDIINKKTDEISKNEVTLNLLKDYIMDR